MNKGSVSFVQVSLRGLFHKFRRQYFHPLGVSVIDYLNAFGGEEEDQ